MGYDSVSILKQIVKSDGSKCSKLDDLFPYIVQKQYRTPFKIGNVDISGGEPIIDVIAIGMDSNWIRNGQYDPCVMSLDWYPFDKLGLSADTTVGESNTGYFSNSQPLYLNYLNKLLMPGIQIKFDDLTKCNSYMNADRGMAYCGVRADPTHTIIPKNYNFWTDIDKNVSNYSRDGTAQDSKGVMEINMLMYATEIVDHLQTKLGYRVPNNTDPYHWSNWLVASSDGKGGSGARYFKLLYLTEFDFYMHNGVMANPSRLDFYLAYSTAFATAMKQIVSVTTNSSTVMNNQYFYSNRLTKGSILPAGQWIYSKDYKYKLHLTQGGNLNVYEFPFFSDDLMSAKNKVMTASSWAANADNILTCYLFVQSDGNVVIYGNPSTSMSQDSQYNGVLQAFIPTGSFGNVRSTANTIVSNFAKANSLSINLSSLSDTQLFKAIINKNTLNAAKILSGSTPTEKVIGRGSPIASSETYGNAYFGMSDYSLLVLPGGALVAVNAGLASKTASNSASMVLGSHSMNKLYTDDANNLQCIHGWRLLNTSGQGQPDMNPIADLTKAGDSKNWCFQNPFLIYTDSDGTNYQFTATDYQQILWYIGDYANLTDSAYAFLTSGFLAKAAGLGYSGGLSISSSDGQLILINYCMRGNRLRTDKACTSMITASLPDNLQRLVDFNMRTRICSNPANPYDQTYCATASPTNLTEVESSLIKLDPKFSVVCSLASAGTIGSSTVPNTIRSNRTYGIPTDQSHMDQISAAIANNSGKLTEPQLLYLRKFYVDRNNNQYLRYTPNNTFIWGSDYLASEEAYRWSPNGAYFLAFQSDGNMVVYKTDTKAAMWSSATYGNSNAVLSITRTGAAVIYQDQTKAKTLWTTNTNVNVSTAFTLDNNGTVVLFAQVGVNSTWTPIWTSNGLNAYKIQPVVVSPIVQPFAGSAWSSMYASQMGLTPLYDRVDTRQIGIPVGMLIYKNSYGIPTVWSVNFDTNDLRVKGTQAAVSSATYSSSDTIWKYFRTYCDINFPSQLAPISTNEAMQVLSTPDIKMLTSTPSPFEQQTWTMNSSNASTNGTVIVYRLISTAAWIAYRRSTGSTLKDADYKALCANNVDACAQDYGNLIASNQLDVSSTDFNAICDIATVNPSTAAMRNDPNYEIILNDYVADSGFKSMRGYAEYVVGFHFYRNKINTDSKTLSDAQLYKIMTSAGGVIKGYHGGFSANNADSMKNICTTAYGVQKCADPANWNKSSFANRAFKSNTRHSTELEHFSGVNCATACSNPNAPKPLLDACKTGALAHCAQSDNIYGSNCTTDMAKYPELTDIKNNWCKSNPDHPEFSNHCPKPSIIASISALISGSDSTATPISDGSSATTSVWTWVLTLIGLIILAAIVAMVVKRRARSGAPSAKISFQNSPNPFTVPTAPTPVATPIVAQVPSTPVATPIVAPPTAAPVASAPPTAAPVASAQTSLSIDQVGK